MQEKWKNITGYNGKYQISNFGNVRSTDRYYKQNNGKGFESEHIYKGKILKQMITKFGYRRIGLSQNGELKYHTIHKLVATEFLPNPNNFPCINHIDGNKANNNINNLEWCTYSHNNKHAREMGLNKGHKGMTYKKRCKLAIEYIKNNFTNDDGLIWHEDFKKIYDILRGDE